MVVVRIIGMREVVVQMLAEQHGHQIRRRHRRRRMPRSGGRAAAYAIHSELLRELVPLLPLFDYRGGCAHLLLSSLTSYSSILRYTSPLAPAGAGINPPVDAHCMSILRVLGRVRPSSLLESTRGHSCSGIETTMRGLNRESEPSK